MTDRTGQFDPSVDEEDFDPDVERRMLEQAIKAEIRTHAPATVKAYDKKKRTVDITVDHLTVVKCYDSANKPDGARVEGPESNLIAILPAMELEGVPVGWLRTKTAYISLPLKANDTGFLHVSDRSLARWLSEGAPVDPVLSLFHQIDDCVFHPELTKSSFAWPSDPTAGQPDDVLVIHCDDGIILDVEAEPDGWLVMAKTLHEYLTALLGAGSPTPGDGGAALKAAWSTYLGSHPFTDFATTKVRAK